MHTYIHTCMHAYIHTYIHTNIHTYMHASIPCRPYVGHDNLKVDELSPSLQRQSLATGLPIIKFL